MPPKSGGSFRAGQLSHWVESIGFVQGTSPAVHEALYAPRAEALLLVRWSESIRDLMLVTPEAFRVSGHSLGERSKIARNF